MLRVCLELWCTVGDDITKGAFGFLKKIVVFRLQEFPLISKSIHEHNGTPKGASSPCRSGSHFLLHLWWDQAVGAGSDQSTQRTKSNTRITQQITNLDMISPSGRRGYHGKNAFTNTTSRVRRGILSPAPDETL